MNALGKFDAVIHNAGVYRIPTNSLGPEGLPVLFAVNSLAPYMLTSLIQPPQRLIYLSSGMHLQGDENMDQILNKLHNGNSYINYSDTKFHDVILTMAVARKWKDVYTNAVNPGWVPTKMGGAGAPDSLEKGYETQVWLAVSDDSAAKVSGAYFHNKVQQHYQPAAADTTVQDKFLAVCKELTGVELK